MQRATVVLMRLDALSLTARGVLAQATPAPDWSAVDQARGREGASQPRGVMKHGFPRSHLQVTAAGVAVLPRSPSVRGSRSSS